MAGAGPGGVVLDLGREEDGLKVGNNALVVRVGDDVWEVHGKDVCVCHVTGIVWERAGACSGRGEGSLGSGQTVWVVLDLVLAPGPVGEVCLCVGELEGLCGGRPTGDEVAVVEEEEVEDKGDDAHKDADAHDGSVVDHDKLECDAPSDGDRVSIGAADKAGKQLLLLDDPEEDACTEVCAVGAEEGGREEKGKEEAVVLLADAVVDPCAVVVKPGDADATEGAVLCACRAGEAAGGAVLGPKEDVVVGIPGGKLGCVLACDDSGGSV